VLKCGNTAKLLPNPVKLKKLPPLLERVEARKLKLIGLIPLILTFSATAPALPNHTNVVNVETASAFFHLLPTSL